MTTSPLPALLVMAPSADGYGSDRALIGILPDLVQHFSVTILAAVDGPMLVTRVTVGDQKIRLVGVHLLSPTSVTRLEFRNEQMKEAAEYLKASDEPTIVMGDFNCTPWSPFLSDFLEATGYRDSRQGFGFQATWHKDLGLFKIPIDHALVSDQVHVHDRFVGQPGGSDHLPIVFTVSVGQRRSEKVADELRLIDDVPFARK